MIERAALPLFQSSFLFASLTTHVIAKNRRQKHKAVIDSSLLGDTNTKNPLSLIKLEKLETQKGIRYNLNICQ
jgi:hypothetical protein